MEKREGIFEAKPGGYGFVRTEDGDVFISASDKRGAIDGDTVEIALTRRQQGDFHAEGKVTNIISEAEVTVVGTVDKGKNAMFVVSENPVFDDVYIPRQKNKKAKDGDKVVVRIDKRAKGGNSPEGTIIEILGGKGEPGIDILAVARSFGLVESFPKKVIREAQQLEFSDEDIKSREDLRSDIIITIDGEDAKDLDDAVSLKKLSNGNYELGVHIADVSHYVRENSELDKEALKRGTSVYLVDRVVPMLPKELSNGLCSLNEKEDKLTLSCIMEIDKDGILVEARIVNSVICSSHRMTYRNVNKILAGDEELTAQYADIKDMLFMMLELSKILRKRRDDRGSIDFEIDEAKIILDDRGFPIDIFPAKRGESEKIIEEFMLMANITVAEQYYYMEIPFLYRVHETPDSEKMKELAVFLNNFGVSLKGFQNIHPKAIQKVLSEAQDTPEYNIINRVTLRSLKKAKYVMEPMGHFGLAAEKYCHFTSPIRRYPDLCDHRIIKHIIKKGVKEKYLKKLEGILPEIAKQSSDRERNAIEAERTVENKKQTEFMSVRIGEEYSGIVSGVTRFGIFVELENTIEGMVPLAQMKDDYYTFFEKNYCVIGERTKKKISLGDKVNIWVVAADTQMGKIEFAFSE